MRVKSQKFSELDIGGRETCNAVDFWLKRSVERLMYNKTC